MKRIGIAVCAVVLVLAVTGIAQAPAKPEKSQMYLMTDCTAKPSMAAQFNDGLKAYVEFYTKHTGHYSWTVYMSDDYHCLMESPVADFADVGQSYKEDEALSTKFATEFQALNNKIKGTYDSGRSFIVTYEPDLSILPEKPRGEGDFVTLDIWHIIPGYEQEFVTLLKEFVALAKAKKIADRWNCLVGGLGSDQPVYMMANHDKGPAEFWAHNADMWNSLGKDATELFTKMEKLLHKRESKFLRYQAELSYSPKK
jgi:hypothetical protein